MLRLPLRTSKCFQRHSLCRGVCDNPAVRLEELRAGDRPEEPSSAQCWDLLAMGEPREVLEEIVGDWADLDWTSLVCEQMHTAVVQPHKYHPEMEALMLLARSMLYLMRIFSCSRQRF